jgi:hypothetical protein
MCDLLSMEITVQFPPDVWRILPPASRLRRPANLGSVGLQKTNLVSSKIAPTRVVRHSSAMGGYERQNQASSTALKPSSRAPSASATDAPTGARVTLPSDLAGSLKYLDDAQLQRLLEAVTVEIDRRRRGTKDKIATAAATRTSSHGQSAALRNTRTGETDEVPEGRANLIRASFRAGIKPAAIARTFRISQSLVNRVLSSVEKPKR